MSERNLIKIGMISSVLSNIISMGGIAGYSSKILLLRRMKVDTNKIAALSILHTNVVNISLALLLPLGLLYIILFNGESEFSKATTWLQTILITGFVIFLNFAIFTKSFKNFAIRIIKKFSAKGINTTLLIEGVESFNTSARSLLENGRKNPYQLIEIIVYSLLDWLASICVLGTCLYMLNSEVGLGVLISTFTIALITSYISFVPGGIGIQEASMTGILALFGVDIYIAILATILFRLFYYVLPLLLAIYIYRFRIKEPEEIPIV